MAEDIDEEIKSNILTRRKEILSKVKQKIDDVLNPRKPTYDPHATPIDILNEIGITEQDYQWALSISPDSDHELHLKRPIDSFFINKYFIDGLKGFAANVDLHPGLIIISVSHTFVLILQRMKLNVLKPS